MADSKHKKKDHDQATIKPAKGRKDELSEKDLEKASGGIGGESQDTGHEKWIE